jgi:hypothetical protein
MDRRLPTYRYPYVGLLGEHDYPDHLGDVNGSRKERLQIRLRKRTLIRTHSCGAIILPVSPVRHNGNRDLLLTLASTSSSGSLSSATPIPKRSPSDLDGIDLIGALGANGRSFSPSITVRLYG